MSLECRFCKIKLTEENWAVGNIKQKQYKCRTCDGIIGRQNYLKRKARQLFDYSIKSYSKIKDGYVYAITNPAWEGWVKIGMAIDAEDRCNAYQTSSPLRDYKIETSVIVKDRRKAESEAHKKAKQIAGQCAGEWFKMPIENAKHIIEELRCD